MKKQMELAVLAVQMLGLGTLLPCEMPTKCEDGQFVTYRMMNGRAKRGIFVQFHKSSKKAAVMVYGNIGMIPNSLPFVPPGSTLEVKPAARKYRWLLVEQKDLRS